MTSAAKPASAARPIRDVLRELAVTLARQAAAEDDAAEAGEELPGRHADQLEALRE